jgi:hypothetical protein
MGSKVVYVTLQSLEKNRRIYLKLSQSMILWLLNAAKKKKLYRRHAKEFFSLRKGQKVSIGFAISLCNELGVTKNALEENIEFISSAKNTNVGIQKPIIPFSFNSAAAVRLIAAIQGDGYFNKALAVGYSNQNRQMIKKVLKSAKQFFGDIDFKLYFREDNTFHLNFPKIAGLILMEAEMKPGFKYSANPPVPSFVFNMEKKLKAVYLKQFFSDEGNVRLKDRRVQVKQTVLANASKRETRANKEKYAPKVLLGCQKLLEDLEVDSKISLGAYRKTPGGIKTDWELSFYRIENLSRFKALVGFEQKYKNDALAKAIASYKFPSAARNGKNNFALEKCKEVEKRFGFIDKEKLADYANRSLKTAAYYLIELKKKGLVEITEKPKRKDGRFKKFKYKVKGQKHPEEKLI